MRAGKLGELNPMFGKVAHNRKEPVTPHPCACACGELATAGRRYVTGHNSRGVRMERYRGWMRWHGYIQVDARDHPFSDKSGFVLEHRLVVEERLQQDDPASPLLVTLGYRRYLRPDIVVHHIDGVKDNNEWGNLMPLTSEEHTRLHHEQGDIHHRQFSSPAASGMLIEGVTKDAGAT